MDSLYSILALIGIGILISWTAIFAFIAFLVVESKKAEKPFWEMHNSLNLKDNHNADHNS
jgi:hypothetical protein